jgi:hypothetical protein
MRRRYWIAGSLGVLLVGTALAVRAIDRPAPSGFAATVTSCDLSTPGQAQVRYAVTNNDRIPHGYRLLVSVASGGTPLGWETSLVDRVGAGTTASARVPVPLTGPGPGATCSVRAEVYDGHAGHHSVTPSG